MIYVALKKHGFCPFCKTQQDFQLFSSWRAHLDDILRYSLLNLLIRMFKSFRAVVMSNVKMTPALRCKHCNSIFIECPYCNSTTLIKGAVYCTLINCGNCERELSVSEIW